jgi:hypothetical protein
MDTAHRLLADRLEQVRLAQPDTAVDEQRVVRLPGLLGDGNGCSVGEPLPGPLTKFSKQ